MIRKQKSLRQFFSSSVLNYLPIATCRLFESTTALASSPRILSDKHLNRWTWSNLLWFALLSEGNPGLVSPYISTSIRITSSFSFSSSLQTFITALSAIYSYTIENFFSPSLSINTFMTSWLYFKQLISRCVIRIRLSDALPLINGKTYQYQQISDISIEKTYIYINYKYILI